MTKEQNALLLKIALNENNLVNGDEPKTYLETSVYKDYVIESPLDRVVAKSLIRMEWLEEFVDEDGDLIIQLTETGFQIFEEI